MRAGRLVRIIATAVVAGALQIPCVAAHSAEPLPSQLLEPTLEEMFPGGGDFMAASQFGFAIAAHRGTALISMPIFGSIEAGPEVGRVAVFSSDRNGVWQRTGTLMASDPVKDDHFGLQVALSDRNALVAARSGVYVFRRERAAWRQVQKVLPPPGEAFEWGLALLDHTAFIASVTAQGTGIVRAHFIDGGGRLHRPRTVIETATGVFGWLAADGDTLVVGAPGEDDARGAVHVFRGFGPFWFRWQKLIAINGIPGDFFGSAVSIDDGRLAIGAPGANKVPTDNCPGPNSGAVHVFLRHHHFWHQQHELPRPHDISSCGPMGERVRINRNWVATQLPTSIFTQGHAVVFERIGGEYVLHSTMPTNADALSVTLELSGASLFIGIPGQRGSVAPPGHVDVSTLMRSPQ